MSDSILQVKGLKIYFPLVSKFLSRVEGYVKAVDGITLEIKKGETLGLVGESGSGKSTLGKGIVCLYPLHAGQILSKGTALGDQSGNELRLLRKNLQMVFQDPYSSFNPRMTVSFMLGEGMKIHGLCSKGEIKGRVNDLLQMVGLPIDAGTRYPHEFSGGQRQRLSIARALSVEPEFIVLDEPVSALDVSMQAKILNLLKDLQERLGLTYLFIAHDLSVVKHMSSRIAVMYLGRVVEVLRDEEIEQRAMHPYTLSLISSIPKLDEEEKEEKIILEGDIPSPIHLPEGCRFQTRCYRVTEQCRRIDPELKDLGEGHQVACLLC
jgi:oligopeptide/dipeptide ABC transporter ATP-binding protein